MSEECRHCIGIAYCPDCDAEVLEKVPECVPAMAEARIAALEAENARLHKFKNEAARILHSLTTNVIRIMEEQLDQSRKVASQMANEIEDFSQEPPHAK